MNPIYEKYGVYVYNGSSDPCDVIDGHCSCGAHHTVEDIERRIEKIWKPGTVVCHKKNPDAMWTVREVRRDMFWATERSQAMFVADFEQAKPRTLAIKGTVSFDFIEYFELRDTTNEKKLVEAIEKGVFNLNSISSKTIKAKVTSTEKSFQKPKDLNNW